MVSSVTDRVLCMQGIPLHDKNAMTQPYYVRGPLSHPAALNTLSQHGVAMLHLVAGLGYDWACISLIRRSADVDLKVWLCTGMMSFAK